MRTVRMISRNSAQQLSVIIPVGARHSDVTTIFAEYDSAISKLGLCTDYIFVLDGPFPEASAALESLMRAGHKITVVSLTRHFGEATALMAGFEHAHGELIATLPAYYQIVGAEIGKLVQAIESSDVTVGVREPRAEGWLEGLRRKAFHRLVESVTGMRFRDLGCGARIMRRIVLEEISLYGD